MARKTAQKKAADTRRRKAAIKAGKTVTGKRRYGRGPGVRTSGDDGKSTGSSGSMGPRASKGAGRAKR